MLPVALSTQLLVQFLTAVSGSVDASAAIRVAAERAAVALEAEVAAIVIGGTVEAIGFPRGRVPEEQLIAVARRTSRTVDVPGIGVCSAIAVPLSLVDSGHFVVARRGAEFTAEESSLLRGMAQTLQLVLDMVRTLNAERTMRERADHQARENADLLHSLEGRHALLEQLVGIQRAISRRAPLQQVLDSIVSGAHALLPGEVASLCLVDEDAAGGFLHVTPEGLPPFGGTARKLSSRAIEGDAVVVDTGHGLAACAEPDEIRLASVMAAPVHEGGIPIGALVIGTVGEARTYTDAERATLGAFAEHVSLAMTDARTLEEMRRAHLDALTGLASRGMFMAQMQQAIARTPEGSLTAVLFLDLDRFKMVNDTLGHRAGDDLLVTVAQRLRGCLRSVDCAARLGGDEFAVLLEDVDDLSLVHAVAERIRTALREPVTVLGQQVFVDASIGVTTTTATTPPREAESMLRDADIAMYEAKRAGTGRTSVFEPQMLTRFEERVRLETDLRRALERDEFVLYYQPITELVSGRVTGVEALVRWLHPRRGMVSPLDFIPVAEETGLIQAIGDLVLRRACEQAATWHRMLPAGTAPYVSVNLSGRQVNEPNLRQQVAAALDSTGLDPNGLVLEITESVLVNDDNAVLRQLRSLKSLGIRLAVDDFGSGYSSLNYLRSFPIDILKIDKSFVDDIATDDGAANLVRAIMALGGALRLYTVAEGVETAAQLAVLADSTCGHAQGYLFSRPMPGPVCTDYLVEHLTGVALHA